MLKNFYKVLFKNFTYFIRKLGLVYALILMFIFFICYENGMNKMEFIECLFLLKYKNIVFIALYTTLISLIVVFLFKYIDIISITNLKEFVIRINDNKKLKLLLGKSIVILSIISTISIVVLTTILSCFLKGGQLDYKRIFLIQIFYISYFICISMCFYFCDSNNMDNNIAYIIFSVFHINNIFPIIPFISVSYVKMNLNEFSYLLGISVYIIISILFYKFSFKLNQS
ncbi:hypothetical protein C3495_01895 [Clostridiaceae bacterium 14S0207]|nr:hypothetical protein C3495_01895 [Clostridiaceae bacterium 14S0207]